MSKRATVVPAGGPLDWEGFAIPGGSIPVALASLRRDPDSRATTSMVRFPAGWTRVGTGSYESAEEFIVLSGELEMNGARFRTGDWVFVPPDVSRARTIAHGDVLAFARFYGPARWKEEAGDGGPVLTARLFDVTDDAEPSPLGVGDARVLNRSGSVTSMLLDNVPEGVVVPFDAEFFSLSDRTWAWIPEGTALPYLEEPCFCRTFDQGDAR
jgi:hypothetical protein